MELILKNIFSSPADINTLTTKIKKFSSSDTQGGGSTYEPKKDDYENVKAKIGSATGPLMSPASVSSLFDILNAWVE